MAATDHVRAILQAYPAGERQPRHAHGVTTVSLVLSGAVREQVGSREETARALSVVVKPAGTEHANQFGGHGASILQIALRNPVADEIEGWRDALAQWGWTHAGPAVPAFLRLLAIVRQPEIHAAATLDAALVEVIAALRPGEPALRTPPARWLQLVRDELDDIGAERVHVWALARRAGVHPVYLARQFRRAFGCSVTEYVQRRRVERAAALITAGGSSLSAISHEAGFADQSHLCRTFRRGTGVSPSTFRALASARERRPIPCR